MNEKVEAALRELVTKFEDGWLFDIPYGSEAYDSDNRASDELASLIATIKAALPTKPD